MSTILNLRRGTEQQIIDAFNGGQLGQSELCHATDIDELILNGVNGLEYFGSVSKDNDVAVNAQVYSDDKVFVDGNSVEITSDGNYVYAQGKWLFFTSPSSIIGPVNISVDGGIPLVARDNEGAPISLAENVTYLLAFNLGGSVSDFFQLTNGNSGGGSVGVLPWTARYDGINDIVTDVNGSDISVEIGDYIYNEGNEVQIIGGVTTIDLMDGVEITTESTITTRQGRKLVKLNSGRLVSVAEVGGILKLYKSDDNGLTWSDFCYSSRANSGGYYGVATDGDYIMLLANTGTALYSYHINGTLQDNSDIISLGNAIDSFTSMLYDFDIVYDNGKWHIGYSGVFSSYPQTTNLKYGFSINDGASWTTNFLSSYNTSVNAVRGVALATNFIGNPVIVYVVDIGSIKAVTSMDFDGSAWGGPRTVYNGGTHVQDNITCDSLRDGTTICAWDGTDSTNAFNNVKFAYSASLGVWSAVEDVSASLGHTCHTPSITRDVNDQVSILFVNADTPVHISRGYGFPSPWVIEDVDGTNDASIVNSGASLFRGYIKPLAMLDPSTSGAVVIGEWEERDIQDIPNVSDAVSSNDIQSTRNGVLEFKSSSVPNVFANGFKSKDNYYT